jgi:hypothetical protein
MALNPIAFARQVNDQFRRYQLSAFPLEDRDLGGQARGLLGGDPLGATPLVKGPYLSLARAFQQGDGLAELAERKVVHPALAGIAEHPSLFAHQQETLESVKAGRHVLVSTGTGSGKTEAFLYPIIDRCLELRDTEAKAGLVAVLIYPMNALAIDQRDRLRALLAGTGITFGLYVGSTPAKKDHVVAHRLQQGVGRESYAQERRRRASEGTAVVPWEECPSEQEITERKPRILLTNAAQLELLLTRGKDLGLFTGAPLEFLVLDEAHTYSGAAGSEVAVLTRRLRAFCGRGVDEVRCIATSATIVDTRESDQAGPSFLSRLFGVAEEQVDLVSERYIRVEWPARRTVPSPPANAEDLLRRALDAIDRASDPNDAGARQDLAAVAEELTGSALALPDEGDPGPALYDHLAASEAVPALADVLEHPRHLADAAKELWRHLRRSGQPGSGAGAEILAYLALAAFAEKDGAPLLRPKMHMFLRGLEGAAATFDGDPPQLTLHFSPEAAVEHDPQRLPSAIFPVAVCRTCGQHYLTAHLHDFRFDKERPAGGEAVEDTILWRPSAEEGAARVRFTNRFLTDLEDDDPETAAAEGRKRAPLWLCRHCGSFHAAASDRCANPPCQRPGPLIAVQAIVAEEGKFECLACGTRSYRPHGRLVEPIRELRATTVADVHILAQEMVDAAPAGEQRLLIFSDNRQDAAFQAGWMRDHARRYRLRYLLLEAIREHGDVISVGDLHRKVEGRLRADLDLARALAPEAFQSSADEAFGQLEKQDLSRFLRIQILRELTTSMKQIASLERWGLARLVYAELTEDNPRVRQAAEQLQRPTGEVVDAAASLLDVWRRDGLLYDVDEPIFSRWWRDGDEDVLRGFVPGGLTQRPPKGLKLRREQDDSDTFVRQVVSAKGLTSPEDFVRKWGLDDVHGALEELWSLVLDLKLLTPAQLVGSKGTALPGSAGSLHVDSAHLGIVAQEARWKCGTCQRIHPRPTPQSICTKYRCDGTLEEVGLPDDDYDLSLLNRPFSMVLAEEHTAQVPAETRERVEQEFKRGARVNTLVATPTLELGVDIGALDLVLCRNVPPTPANYWQRVGRAGRRRRMAVLYTYCRRAVHDTYFFADPMRLLGAPVRPPRFNLKNDVLVRKHAHAVVLSELLRLRSRRQLAEAEEAVLDRAFPTFVRDYLYDGMQFRMQPPDLSGLAGLLSQHRDQLIDAVKRVFEAGWPVEASDEAAPDRLTEAVDELPEVLEETVGTLHQRFLWTVRTLQQLTQQKQQGLLEKEDEQLLRRCETYLKVLREDRASTYTLSVLAVEGFLPGYGTYDGGVTAFPARAWGGGAQFELSRGKAIAVREFVSGNLLYANRGRYRVSRFHFPVGEEEVHPDRYRIDLEHGRVTLAGAGADGYADAAPADLEALPICDVDLAYLSPIRDEELERFQMPVAMLGYVQRERRGGHAYTIGSSEVWLLHGQGLRLINAGPADQVRRAATGDGQLGYPICRVCGATRSPYSSVADFDKFTELHTQRCGRPPGQLGFYADVTADALRFRGLDDEAAAANLGETLRVGCSQLLEMEPEDLDTLMVPNEEGTTDLYLYDPMPGGSGLLQQILERWEELVPAFREMLEECPNACEKACYQCLLTGRNVYWHRHLDRHRALDLVAHYDGRPEEQHELPPQTEGRRAGDQRGTHPPEDRLAALLRSAGFDGFEAQHPVEIGPPYDRTVPDFVYVDPDASVRVAVYLDGLSKHLHGNPKQAQVDAIIRDQLEDRDWSIIEIPASTLDDPEILKLHFKKIARSMGQKDAAAAVTDDISWYEQAAADLADQAAEAPGTFDAEAIADLDLLDPALAALVQAAVHAGADAPAVGLEVGSGNWPLEAVWTEEKVALIDGADERRDAELAGKGWVLLDGQAATAADLLRELGLHDAEGAEEG